MFCHKCGNEVSEGAAFCPKCGAKLAGGEIQKPDKPIMLEMPGSYQAAGREGTNKAAPKSAEAAYHVLQENASGCPEIRSVIFQEKRGITIVKGKISQYTVGVSNGNYKMAAFPVFPFNLFISIIVFTVVWAAYTIGWNAAEGYGTDFEEIYLVLGIGLLIGGLLGTIISIFGRKEKKKVSPFIYHLLGQAEPKKSFPADTLIYSVLALAGAAVLVIGSGLLDEFSFSDFGRRDEESDTYDDSLIPSDDKKIDLGQQYTNAAEGFAFSYPDGWGFFDDGSGDVVAVSNTGEGVYLDAYFAVGAYIPDEFMSMSRAEYEQEFSAEYEDFSVSEFTDIYLDGIRARKVAGSCAVEDVGIMAFRQYYYINGDTMYLAYMACLQEECESFSPIFDAIMDSYKITQRMAVDAENTGDLRLPDSESEWIADSITDDLILSIQYYGGVAPERDWVVLDYLYTDAVGGHIFDFWYKGEQQGQIYCIFAVDEEAMEGYYQISYIGALTLMEWIESMSEQDLL